jgi:alpha-N-acetylglucosaminidase
MVNGGGTVGMEGRLLRVLMEPGRAKATGAGRSMTGIGIVPEGIANNDIMYSSLLQSAWSKDFFSVDAHLKKYTVSRYGKYDADIYEAWQLLLQSAYLSHTNELTDAYESIFCARPDTNFITNVSTWGSKKLPYDPVIFYKAAECFARAAGRFTLSETYRYDLADIWRQVIALKGRGIYASLMKAWNEQDLALFAASKERFINLLELQDRWEATNSAFRLDTWIRQARSMLPDEKDKDLAEWNARVQVTYWGPDSNPATLVHDYANKEWSGLLKDYYLPRWLLFFDYAEKRLKGEAVSWPDFFAMEKAWARRHGTTVDGVCGEDAIKILPEIINKLK